MHGRGHAQVRRAEGAADGRPVSGTAGECRRYCYCYWSVLPLCCFSQYVPALITLAHSSLVLPAPPRSSSLVSPSSPSCALHAPFLLPSVVVVHASKAHATASITSAWTRAAAACHFASSTRCVRQTPPPNRRSVNTVLVFHACTILPACWPQSFCVPPPTAGGCPWDDRACSGGGLAFDLLDQVSD